MIEDAFPVQFRIELTVKEAEALVNDLSEYGCEYKTSAVSESGYQKICEALKVFHLNNPRGPR